MYKTKSLVIILLSLVFGVVIPAFFGFSLQQEASGQTITKHGDPSGTNGRNGVSDKSSSAIGGVGGRAIANHGNSNNANGGNGGTAADGSSANGGSANGGGCPRYWQ